MYIVFCPGIEALEQKMFVDKNRANDYLVARWKSYPFPKNAYQLFEAEKLDVEWPVQTIMAPEKARTTYDEFALRFFNEYQRHPRFKFRESFKVDLDSAFSYGGIEASSLYLRWRQHKVGPMIAPTWYEVLCAIDELAAHVQSTEGKLWWGESFFSEPEYDDVATYPAMQLALVFISKE